MSDDAQVRELPKSYVTWREREERGKEKAIRVQQLAVRCVLRLTRVLCFAYVCRRLLTRFFTAFSVLPGVNPSLRRRPLRSMRPIREGLHTGFFCDVLDFLSPSADLEGQNEGLLPARWSKLQGRVREGVSGWSPDRMPDVVILRSVCRLYPAIYSPILFMATSGP